jgi:hypothetical protein
MMPMESGQKVRENLLRRMAKRQGLALHKSRRRDPYATGYGTYWLTRGRRQVSENVDLDAIEAYLKRSK